MQYDKSMREIASRFQRLETQFHEQLKLNQLILSELDKLKLKDLNNDKKVVDKIKFQKITFFIRI